MSGLGLVPNEVVGYRVVADTYSWNVVIVKKHGKDSKLAGQEYANTLGYYKDVKSAFLSVMDRAMKEQLMGDGQAYIGKEEQWIAALEAGRKAVEDTAAAFQAFLGENHEGFRKYLRAVSHNTALSGSTSDESEEDSEEA